MKKMPPVVMGSVVYDWSDDAVDSMRYDIDNKVLSEYTNPPIWGITPVRPEVAISLDMNKVKSQVIVAKIKELLPKSEKYEWDVASDYSLPTMSHRLGLRLRSAYVFKDPRQNVDIYAVHDVYHFDNLISDDAYLKAVVDKLVQTLVHELARIEKERLKHEYHKDDDVHDSEEWPLAKKSGHSRLVRESTPSNPKVSAPDYKTGSAIYDAGTVGLNLSQSYGSGSTGLSDSSSPVTVSFDSGTGGDFSGGGGGTDF